MFLSHFTKSLTSTVWNGSGKQITRLIPDNHVNQKKQTNFRINVHVCIYIEMINNIVGVMLFIPTAV
jgi:hypothetical protein